MTEEEIVRAIDNLCSRVSSYRSDTVVVSRNIITGWLKDLQSSQKACVPAFVGAYINKCKSLEWHAAAFIGSLEKREHMAFNAPQEVIEYYLKHPDNLMKAWLNGWTAQQYFITQADGATLRTFELNAHGKKHIEWYPEFLPSKTILFEDEGDAVLIATYVHGEVEELT